MALQNAIDILVFARKMYLKMSEKLESFSPKGQKTLLPFVYKETEGAAGALLAKEAAKATKRKQQEVGAVPVAAERRGAGPLCATLCCCYQLLLALWRMLANHSQGLAHCKHTLPLTLAP